MTHQERTQQLERIMSLIHKLVCDNYFGDLTVKFVEGKVVLLEKRETIKIDKQ